MKKLFIFIILISIATGLLGCQKNTTVTITSVPLHFINEVYSFKGITISQSMVKKIFKEYKFNGCQFIIFQKTDDDENAHSGVIINQKIYDFGEVATLFQTNSVKFDTVNLYGDDLVKIQGSFGAIYAPTRYYAILTNGTDKFPYLELNVENYAYTEIDLDGDGQKEVIETSMSSAFIHKYIQNSFHWADLLADINAKNVSFDPSKKLFTAYFENESKPKYYEYKQGTLIEK